MTRKSCRNRKMNQLEKEWLGLAIPIKFERTLPG